MSFVGAVGTVFGQTARTIQPLGFEQLVQPPRTGYVKDGSRLTDKRIDDFFKAASNPSSPVAKQLKK